MIISMTGFGRGVSSTEQYEAQVEVRTVNHRFLDFTIKLPKAFETRESDIRDIARKHVIRGRVNINITLKEADEAPVQLDINEAVVKSYRNLLDSIRTAAGIAEPVRLEHLLNFGDIFVQPDAAELPEEAWQCTAEAIEKAFVELNAMRRREGAEIEKDLRSRIDNLGSLIDQIETLAAGRSQDEFAKLKGRIDAMLDSGELDPARLELEIALLADRVDVTEECIRFKSHNTLFIESLEQPESVGRKLNFLLQEMNREANTIGAKASNAEIAHLVVLLKEEVEKLREQIQNIE